MLRINNSSRRNFSTKSYRNILRRNDKISSEVLKFKPIIQKHRIHFFNDTMNKDYITSIHIVENDKLINIGSVKSNLDNHKICDVNFFSHTFEFLELGLYLKTVGNYSKQMSDLTKLSELVEEDFCLRNHEKLSTDRLVHYKNYQLLSMKNYFAQVQNISREIYIQTYNSLSLENKRHLKNRLSSQIKYECVPGYYCDDRILVGFNKFAPTCFLTPLGIFPISKIDIWDYELSNEFFNSLEKNMVWNILVKQVLILFLI